MSHELLQLSLPEVIECDDSYRITIRNYTTGNTGRFRNCIIKEMKKLFLLMGESDFFFNWYSVGGGVQSVHSALQPLIGLLCQPRVIMMMEKLVE
jgi:hypothetical protein